MENTSHYFEKCAFFSTLSKRKYITEYNAQCQFKNTYYILPAYENWN